jgi:cyclomaltodextrinase
MPRWIEHAVWWHLHPLTFLGAEPEAPPAGSPPVPRLRALEPWLSYLVELGCNGLALGPVFASTSHGYDTVDHGLVDPRLGTEEDLRWLLDACHERGVRVLLDGVFNHVGRGFWAFRDVLARGQESEFASWFRLDFDEPGPDGFAYAAFEGHRHLVTLAHETPAVAEYVAGVMGRWLEVGADGWRLDAAYAVPLRFWRDVAGRVRARHPEAWLVGEVIHGDYPRWATEGGLDSVTQYELWKAIWSSLNDRNLFELAWALDRHNRWLADLAPLTFVGNHDVTRLASRVDDGRHLGHALAILFTLGGVPSVYAGDEQGFQGVKGSGPQADAPLRPAFPAGPAGLAAHGWPLYRLHQHLIGMRRRHQWLHRARTRVLDLANRRLAYRVAAPAPDPTAGLIVLLNLDDRPHDFAVDVGAAAVVAASEPGRGASTLVPAHGWAVLDPGPAPRDQGDPIEQPDREDQAARRA